MTSKWNRRCWYWRSLRWIEEPILNFTASNGRRTAAPPPTVVSDSSPYKRSAAPTLLLIANRPSVVCVRSRSRVSGSCCWTRETLPCHSKTTFGASLCSPVSCVNSSSRCRNWRRVRSTTELLFSVPVTWLAEMSVEWE